MLPRFTLLLLPAALFAVESSSLEPPPLSASPETRMKPTHLPSAPAVSRRVESASESRSMGVRVAVSASDTRFHAHDCPRLDEIDRFLSLDAAMLNGYGPCTRCSREILAQTPQPSPIPPRSTGRAVRRGSARSTWISGGPPYIVVIQPKRRPVNTYPLW